MGTLAQFHRLALLLESIGTNIGASCVAIASTKELNMRHSHEYIKFTSVAYFIHKCRMFNS